jgi:hypothetical protein
VRSKPTYWDKISKEIRPKFAAAGLLETCELRWDSCLANRDGIVPKAFQTFAHSLRRRKIDKYKKSEPEEYERRMREVIRACTQCHHILDNELEDDKHHTKAEEIVIETINKRKKPVV